ncbi:MAG: signal recognition particle protein [Acholeplasmatales bacterium]|jgi:signal recognition particle subunit SRP54|nr:signal recognition particle protein [Acholeplasmatales bacterium]
MSLGSRIQMALRRVTGRGYLNEKDIDDMLREIRLSLLEADVNFSVVKSFTASIKEKAYGEKILKGLNPGEQVVKIVKDELINAFGKETASIKYKVSGITVIMAIGLQGSGKTTSIAKLGLYARKIDNKKPMFIACDIYRPAAIEQLIQLGKQVNIEVYQEGQGNPLKIVKNGLEYAKKQGYDLVIIDTAGRLSIDEDMINELIDIKKLVSPDEILLTIDAMTGQDAAVTAKNFCEKVGATGAIITKLDGDTRGGAALSVNSVASIPIMFSSSGEQITLDSFEVFHPDRMASRIIGMGDMLTLIEDVENNIDEKEASDMMEKLASGTFNYDDLLKQFKMIKRMGSISRILGFIPGLGKFKEATSNIDDKQFDRFSAIMKSMTKQERKHPELIEKGPTSFSRRKRIALGSGFQVSDINKLIQALDTQKKMMGKMAGMSEEEISRMSKNPSALASGAQSQYHGGKGKNKGSKDPRFRR